MSASEWNSATVSNPPITQAPAMTATAAPHSTRNANIDAIRGVAVLGIFFLNIYFMSNSFYGYAPHLEPPISDVVLEVLSNFFLEGRFISLFSLLFGVGLFIQSERFCAQGITPYPLLKSRLRWLIVFGLIHGIVIWPGDILLTYGISGFLTLMYLDDSVQSLKKRACWFIFIAVSVMALISLAGEDEGYYRNSELFTSQYALWTGDYFSQLKLHLMQVGYMALIIPLTLMWFTAGIMLLGIALYKEGTFNQGMNTNTLYPLLAASLVLSTLDSLMRLSGSFMLMQVSGILVLLSAIPMAMVYLHVVVKICQNRTEVLKGLQQVGKLAFSFYILQSICGVLLFRYVAPEWQLNLDRWGYMLIAISFGLLQLLLAHFYLRFFKQGPLEALWRRLAFKQLSNN